MLVKLTPNITDIRYAGARGGQGRRRRAVAHQHDQRDHGRRPRHVRPRAARARQVERTAATAARRSSRSRCTWSPPSRATRRSTCRSRASAASRPGRTRSSSCCSARARVQVCTAVMHYGFRIVEDMIEGLENYMREKGFARAGRLRGQGADQRVTDWGDLDLNYKIVAAHRPRQVHPLQPVLHRLRGRRAPVHLAGGAAGGRPRLAPVVDEENASAATSARSSAPSTAASR